MSEILYSEGMIGSMKLKNRWIMLAMHTGYAAPDGTFSELDHAFYELRAAGGAAALTLVASPNLIGAQADMHILDAEGMDQSLKQVCDMIHHYDCKVILQLFHAGRNNNESVHPGILPIAPSPVPSPIYRTVPREMTEQDIQDTIRDFARGALLCKECGVDAVEVSVSVGYLLTQFLSPRVNQRTDRWGGSRENRMRFPTEVLKAIREAVGPDYPVIIKISGGDMLGGYDLQDMVDFILQLPAGTIDGVTVTGGWHEAPVPLISYHVTPGAFSYLCREIRQKTGLPVIACNRINSPEVAEEHLQAGDFDFAGAARPFLTDPEFVNKTRLGKPYFHCQACNKGCIEKVLRYQKVNCAFRPETGRETEDITTSDPRKILVVGAGPVGLEAAWLSGRAGHNVTVITEGKETGGKLPLVAKIPYKQEFIEFRNTLLAELAERNIPILSDTPLTEEILDRLQPDTVIIASGAEPVIPDIPGIDDLDHDTAEHILSMDEPGLDGAVCIIGGGSVGLETAELLAGTGRCSPVTVIEMLPKAGKDLGGLKWIMMKELKELGVTILTGTRVESADENGLIVTDAEGQITEIHADHVLFAAGTRPRGDLGFGDALRERGIPFFVIGDGGKTRNIMDGLRQAFDTVLELR